MKNVTNFDEFNKVNEARYVNPVDCIQQYLRDAFVYLWDDLGMELTVKDFNEYMDKAVKTFDIKKQLSWGNRVPEK